LSACRNGNCDAEFAGLIWASPPENQQAAIVHNGLVCFHVNFEGASVVAQFSAIFQSTTAVLLSLLFSTLCFSQTAGNPQATQPQMMSRSEVIGIIAASRKIVSPNGVEELLPLQINGTTQWVSIRGRDRHNPILLFLHGGPGSPTMPEDYTFQTPWEDYFTVVQWDQRGTGKTYASNDPAPLASTMTIAQMTSDTEEVIQYLLKNFGKKKIFLLGHSWGSVLGLAVAQRHPEWLYAYLGVGQLINTQRGEEDGYRFALDEARSHHNPEAEKELLSIAPYPGTAELTFARIGVQRKWLMFYGGLTYGRTDFTYDGNAWSLSPDYTDKDLDIIDQGSLYSLTHLLGALESLNYEEVVRFRCPIFLFEGRHDYDISHALAAEWFKQVDAPSKKLVWFDNSAHMVMQEEPGRFLYHLITDLRPIAVEAGDGPAPE
jgi:pimeloyl-ACP methyl ester carboxylesterase